MKNKPFSNSYVMKETIKHMQNCVRISLNKTLARMPEFKDDPEKNKELMTTLSNLDKLNRLMENIRDNNQSVMKEKDNA